MRSLARAATCSLAVFLAFASLACSGEARAWDDASKDGSIAALERYVAAHPAGKHAADAKRTILLHAWSEARREYDPAVCAAFLAERGDSITPSDRASIVEAAWNQAELVDTREAWSLLSTVFPFDERGIRAAERLDQLDWNDATEMDSASGYSSYLRDHPKGAHAHDAASLVEARHWESATEKDDFDGYDAFIAAFPSSGRIQDARVRREAAKWAIRVRWHGVPGGSAAAALGGDSAVFVEITRRETAGRLLIDGASARLLGPEETGSRLSGIVLVEMPPVEGTALGALRRGDLEIGERRFHLGEPGESPPYSGGIEASLVRGSIAIVDGGFRVGEGSVVQVGFHKGDGVESLAREAPIDLGPVLGLSCPDPAALPGDPVDADATALLSLALDVEPDQRLSMILTFKGHAAPLASLELSGRTVGLR